MRKEIKKRICLTLSRQALEILDKEITDAEKINYNFMINYNNELMMTKININKIQLQFFLSILFCFYHPKSKHYDYH
jgi:hypothetical protein